VKRGSPIAGLCERHGLGRDAQHKLETLVELLATDAHAPTSVTDPAEATDAHIADSLSGLPVITALLAERPPAAIVDIGSGAGFPGLPLAIALERSAIDLVEATARKCEFIARAIERVELPNARVVCMRAEDWARGEGAGRYQVALARALAPLATLVEYASPLLAEGGSLVAWKGARDVAEEGRGDDAARAVGMSTHTCHAVTPFTGSRLRHLHVFQKIEPTPAGIPRRPGIARKRPLGKSSSTPKRQ
jgi:16S rRNA (guanine527-N7)-methyltransferase